jgi:prolyl oligopeptidase
MKKRWTCAFAVLFVPMFLQAQKAPPSRTEPFSETFHGQVLVDPYHWLEDSDSPETRQWITAQNGFAHSLLDPRPARGAIADRLTAMSRHDRVGAPVRRGDYFFFSRQHAGEELPSYYRRKGVGGQDELLLDPHSFDVGAKSSLQQFGVSDDGGVVAYGVRHGGQDETDLRLLDVATRKDLPDHMPTALYGGFAFDKDRSGFFYTLRKRESDPHLRHHRLGTASEADTEIFGTGLGTGAWVSPTVSEDGRYLLISVQQGWSQSDLYLRDLRHKGPVTPLIKGLPGKFDGFFDGDILFVQTDWKASKGRILRIDLRDPAQEKWREVVPSGEDAISSSGIIGGKLFVTYLHNVTSRILIFDEEGKATGEVPLPGLGAADVWGRADQDGGMMSFSSYTAPYSMSLFSASSGKQTVWYQDAVPFQSKEYVTEQVWYPSKDGTKIPMFLIHRKGFVATGKTPTILYGYGGFDLSLTPWFDPQIAWWIEHDGLYAVANLRGGGEFGEDWHKAGMLDKKQNVFDDFNAAAQWLIGNSYTNPEKLAIWGGSNGGLLVAAALTQRPDLYRAVICWHPDLDMVRYYRYTKNNNPPALLEYGNGAIPDQFKYLLAYSPYENVHANTRYPAVLFESGDADTRVPPEQARKMTARLQAATAQDRPVMLLYQAGAGHAGGTPLAQRILDDSYELTFVSWQLGLEPAKLSDTATAK